MSTAAMPAIELPDVNAETNPYPLVQRWLDQTADFCFHAAPDHEFSRSASIAPQTPEDYFGINGGYGIHFSSALQPLSAVVQRGLRVDQRVGPRVGRISARCLFGPDDLRWLPGGEPEPRLYDPFRSRRFTLNDVTFQLGQETCGGYGIGRTYPMMIDGRSVTMIGGVGNIMAGVGRFAGCEGTFAMTGMFTPELGFEGNVTLRIIDPAGRFRSDREVDLPRGLSDASVRSTFFVFRGEKKDRTVRTTFGPPRDGELCLVTPSQMRTTTFPCVERQGIVQSNVKAGPVTAGMNASVYFNLFAPPGNALAPVPFTTEEVYTFHGPGGCDAGTIHAEVRDGISFALRFPSAANQPGVRFSGFGPIIGGTGRFEGVRGMLTVNSLIGISPHALSLLHVLHVVDPRRKHREGGPRRP